MASGDSEAIAGKVVNGGVGFAQKHVLPGHDYLETIQHFQLDQCRACAAAAGGRRQGQKRTVVMKLAHQADCARNGGDFEPHLLEDAILAPAQLFELLIWTIPEKVAQNVGAFTAIENEVQLEVGYIPTERLKKLPPSLAMYRMTVDENSVHVKNDASQLPGSHRHEIFPVNIWEISLPGQVTCASW